MGDLEYIKEYNITIAAVNHNGVEGKQSRAAKTIMEIRVRTCTRTHPPVPQQFPAERAFMRGIHIQYTYANFLNNRTFFLKLYAERTINTL